MGVRSFLRHAFNDLPLAASLWALAAVALPGVGGLVILTLAGVRIGYRQAKAGFVLRTAGIARFARAGPLGVVRSGSFVVVRSGASGVVRPRALMPDIFSIKSPSRLTGIRLSLGGGRRTAAQLGRSPPSCCRQRDGRDDGGLIVRLIQRRHLRREWPSTSHPRPLPAA